MRKLLLAAALVLSSTSAFAATSEEYQCTIKGDAMIQTLPNDDGREITYYPRPPAVPFARRA